MVPDSSSESAAALATLEHRLPAKLGYHCPETVSSRASPHLWPWLPLETWPYAVIVIIANIFFLVASRLVVARRQTSVLRVTPMLGNCSGNDSFGKAESLLRNTSATAKVGRGEPKAPKCLTLRRVEEQWQRRLFHEQIQGSTSRY